MRNDRNAAVMLPLHIKPGRLFGEFLDCRLRQFQNGCAEAISQKIKAALNPTDKRLVRMFFETQARVNSRL
jgi:hypothetical protein